MDSDKYFVNDDKISQYFPKHIKDVEEYLDEDTIIK